MASADIQFLSKIPFLSELTEQELLVFDQIVKLVKFKENEIIMTEGEEGVTMYIFREGLVQVVNNITLKVGTHKWSDAEKSIATLDAQKIPFFGEMSLITGAPRSATIKAISSCVLYEIHRDNFVILADKYPSIAFKILWKMSAVLCDRIKAMNGNILKLTTALSIALSRKKK